MVSLLDAVNSKLTSGNVVGVLLLSSTIMVTVFTTFILSTQVRSFRGFWAHLVPPGILSHPSARADFLFFASKRLLKLAWVFPAGLSAVSIGALVHHGLAAAFAIDPTPGDADSPWLGALFTVSMLLTHDFAYYLYHRALHKVPALWELHKVHHSAEHMVGTTDERTHPLDDLIFYAWSGLLVGFLFGVWMFFIPNVEVVIFGLNAVVLSKILSFGYARHLPYKMSFGWLNAILNCPHYHQLHHSKDPAHYDRNFGLSLIIWDRMFGTVAVPKPGEDFIYGLSDNEAKDYHSVVRLYSVPLVKLTAMAQRKLRSLRPPITSAGETIGLSANHSMCDGNQ